MSRSFLLGLLGLWGAAALMLYWLAPGLAATYLVASVWVAFIGAAIWALARWPPFRRAITKRRTHPKDPDGEAPGR